MNAPAHDVALLSTSGRPVRSTDAQPFAPVLDEDGYLRGARTVAGALLALAVAATLITSLFGAPTVAWTVLLAVVAAGLIVVKREPVVRRDRRLPTDPCDSSGP